jgi:phenylalanyl-tRNA synthetase beta chain
MKISEKWLREWVSPKLDTQALAHRLTMAGLEVGAIAPVAPPLEHVVVGEIVSMTPHPSADRLNCCRVNIGKSVFLDIVCGATNAVAGMKAPVALEGAKLPNGTVIKKTKIRGVPSSGMLCSAVELGIEESAEGLLVLEHDAKPGMALVEYLGLDDNMLEVDLTPNRGDCLSVAGLARELAAITGAKYNLPKIRSVPAKSKQRVAIVLDAEQDCPSYVGRVVADINPDATTPIWMKERLRRCGVRSIHPVVDVTNYVMLELGQPMHAFDLEKLSGAIHVRHAGKGEQLTLLDGKSIQVEPGSLLIADNQRPLALAGIMGGLDTAVGSTTRQIFFESAWFRPEAIAGRARSYGMQTESSQRFERGVEPGLQKRAIERATSLLLAIAGGKPGPVVEKTVRRHLPHPEPILLRAERADRLLGMRIPAKDVENTLLRLGMRVTKSGKGWKVMPAAHRFDVNREVDLIEEIARIHGYEKLPSVRPAITMAARPVSETRVTESRLRSVLVDRDYQEVITYSFIDPASQAMLDPGVVPIMLANPIAADMAAMRTNLWAGLLQTIVYNQNRQQSRVRLFEIGRSFVPQSGGIAQERMLAGAVTGEALAEQWGMPKRAVDFYDAKADVEALLALAGFGVRLRCQPGQHLALHPGQTAELYIGENRVGILGVLHPEQQSKLGLDRPVILFELKIAAILAANAPIFHEISKFPAIRRDLALVVTETTPAQQVLDCVASVAGKLLINLELFDEYRGKGIDSGRKSLALGLTLQDSSRTLNEAEVEGVMTKVISALQSELGAVPRQ